LVMRGLPKQRWTGRHAIRIWMPRLTMHGPGLSPIAG